jgi:hypothetical protein
MGADSVRIVVILRTLNEERNIIRFCRSYADADKVLVADGGSHDLTIRLARMFDNVEVRPFDIRHDFRSVIFNDQPAQLNYLIDWAVEEGADWIVYDDCDCVPTEFLRCDMRAILESATVPIVCAYRLYIWGNIGYLPRMNIAGRGLWAWRPDEMPGIRGDTSLRRGKMGMVGVPGMGDRKRVHLDAPFCLMHYFAPDRDEVERKMMRYAARGDPQDAPEESEYWPPEPLPMWAQVNLYGAGDGIVEPPALELRSVKTDTVKCAFCKARTRSPRWYANQCEICGCPTTTIRRGRPFGRYSKRWSELKEEFQKLLALFAPDRVFLNWLLGTVGATIC